MKFDNPASRLHAVLTKICSNPTRSHCKSAWKDTLNIDSEDDILLVSKIGKVLTLPEKAINLLQEFYPNTPSLWTNWEDDISKAFLHQNLTGELGTFKQHINSHTLNYLSLAGDMIENHFKIELIEVDKLNDLRNKFNELINELLSSNLDVKLKKYIISHLKDIVEAIDDYNIMGALPILNSVESSIGHAFLNQNYKDFLSKNDMGKKMLELLSATADLVTVATAMPQLSMVVTALITQIPAN